jgi:hypothetical protein
MEKKQKKYHTGGTVLKFDRKILNTGTKLIPLRHIHLTFLAWWQGKIPLRHIYISPFWLGGEVRFP